MQCDCTIDGAGSTRQPSLAEPRCPSPTSSARAPAGRRRSIRARVIICARCGAPLLARYDLERLRSWTRETLRDREPTLWRYRELLPVFPGESPVTLGEGFTPLLHAPRLGAELGLSRALREGRVAQPDQFVQGARAIHRRHPRAGAGRHDGLGAHGRQRRLRHGGLCRVGRPRRARLHAARRQAGVRRRVRACSARTVELVDGLITDAGRVAAETRRPLGGTTSRR